MTYDPYPYLSAPDKVVQQAWAAVIKRRSQSWDQTEAAQMFKALGLGHRYLGIRAPLRRFYARGRIDASIGGLEAVARGDTYLTGFGDRSRQVLGGILIEWYKHKAAQ
jgi:hypothetical protein